MESRSVAERFKSAIPPRRAPVLRVGFLMPNLLMGGVEHWLLGLLKHNDRRLSWSVCVTNPFAIEPEMRREAEPFAEVVTGEAALAALVANADVMVAWGVYGLDEMLKDFTGPVVQVSHGCGAWTEHFLAANRAVITHCVAVSRAAATAFGHARVTIIPNGVDPRRCEPLRPRDVVRREWGLLPHEIAVGFVGRISPEKNPLATSHAVRALGPGYRAVYVGKGYGEDMRPAARDLTPNAIFVPPMQQVGDALHALDCLIMASPAEGFSLVLIESLMAGLPVVATPRRGHSRRGHSRRCCPGLAARSRTVTDNRARLPHLKPVGNCGATGDQSRAAIQRQSRAHGRPPSLLGRNHDAAMGFLSVRGSSLIRTRFAVCRTR